MTLSEEEKVNALKQLVDQTASDIRYGQLSEDQARKLIAATRLQAEELIPDDMDKYDLIYTARFERLFEQFIRTRKE